MIRRVIGLFYTLLLLFPLYVAAQPNQVEGIVLDANTGETMPFVNIHLLPGNEGGTTDFEGIFKLKVPPKTKSLKFSYLGYETKIIPFNEINDPYLEIKLEESSVLIDEAVVIAKKKKKLPKDTAAISLQQRVVDNKENNRPKAYDSYHYKEHTKIQYDLNKLGEKFPNRKLLKPVSVIFDYVDTADNGDAYLPLLFQEELSEYYYDRASNREKDILHGRYLTGVQNASTSDITDEIFRNIDLYDNNIIAGGKPFASPFSTSGLLTYLFFLTDSMVLDGDTLYRLDFTPKNKTTIAFTGYAWIEKQSYAMQSVEFKVPSKADINFVNDFYIKQSFSKFDSSAWFMTGEEIQISMNIRKKKDKGSFRVTKKLVRDSIEINVPIDDSVFQGDKYIIADSVSKRSREWWTENRIDSLSRQESGVLTMSDSIERTRIFKTLLWFGHVGTTGFLKAGPVEFGRFYTLLSWNEIEGIRPKLGIRTNKDFNENIQLWGYLAYGTRDKEWKYLASARLKLPSQNKKWHVFQISYQKDFTFLGQDYEDQKFSHDNILQSITRSTPLSNIMTLENFELIHEREWIKGLTTTFSVNRTNFYQVPDVFEFQEQISPTETKNANRFGIMEFGTKLNMNFGQKFFENDYYRFPTASNKPVAELAYKVGVKDFADGDFDYHKLQFEYYHRWSHLLGVSKYNITAAKIFGDIPYPLSYMPIGNEANFRNNNSFELMNEYEFAGDQFASFWLSHHFEGKILNNIPLIKLLKFRSIFTFKGIVGSMKESNQAIYVLPEGMSPLSTYAEIGFGVENILKVARVDFVWRLTQRELMETRKFGVRFSFDLSL